MSEEPNIVIVGIGCRFPGANNVDEFWRLLKNGENHLIEVPPDRWNIETFYDADPSAPGKMYVRQGGFIPGVEDFDNRHFGISDEEARMMDPQQRLVLHCVHMALEDGGITRAELQKGKTGVYIGSMTYDYNAQANEDATICVPYSVTGNHFSIISARVSYVYNLTGPAMTIDTACSSSLVAINTASQALLLGDCDMAICGGVNCLFEPNVFVALCKAHMLSPHGQCRTFTKQADGYARGEGCGIVILKRMHKAIEQNNKIWGLIQSGTNQDGQNAQPISAPSGLQQEKLMEELFTKCNLDRNKIQVIEAHGTGTAIGDPTECRALGKVLGSKKFRKYLGSVKTNIGHLEAAAGVAGLIKVLLMMKYKTIVPSLWYSKENENPDLKLGEIGFTVPTICIPWDVTANNKRQASVNSFGFGGTNAHAVVTEVSVCQSYRSVSTFPLPAFVVISSHDEDSLYANIASFTERLKSGDYNLRSLSFTSTCKRDFMPIREALFADNHNRSD
ncbi:putative inactive phenolphthiocerol synthesis polyketide synthase type I Pks15 [Dreissena polymorpha]|uniref:Ketosynthase family 3 (KS3) domain-containing protein n=1 Tax=Dreissena polymorpha TaxID=45954 RepID=A0A9D4FWE3_DREPO|nr:putative inactive phenolphthiocerol synthesis polyketide synthase type I Pks15 [Dreissena polymorpha]XP_052217709.1 putative inactive phenolphthiocerol synthesis polyketide synthase type I Pks15 [Dreissena polymorpha]KAH3806529.1 hypothetical protein DPMN_134852 [Dreissena polymorpha]